MPAVLATAGILLPLSLDTFALASALGVSGLEPRHRLRVALIFTAFEAGMPVLGLLAGSVVGHYIGDFAGWAGIAALAIAGIVLARGGGEEAEERQLHLLKQTRGLAIVDLGLAISVDELAVGFSAGLLAIPIALAVVWIGVQAFVATQIGLRLGARVSEALRERSERAAGVALLGVALVLLVLRLWESKAP